MAVAWCLGLVLLALQGGAWSGQDSYDYDPLGRLVRHIDASGRATDYQYDPAGNIVSVGAPESAGAGPVLTTVLPAMVRRGDTRSLTLSGKNLRVGTLRAADARLALSQVRQQAGEIRAELAVSPQAPVGEQRLLFSNSQGTASLALLVGPSLPQLALEPNPLALPPNNRPHGVTVRLSGADVVPHEISVTSSDATRLTVSPAQVLIAAGQTTAQLQVLPRASGFANLTLTSPLLKTLVVPVFVTSDFRGVNTSEARPVGVRVGPAVLTKPPPSVPASVVAPRVGVALGPVLTGVSPPAMPVGTRAGFSIGGRGLPPGLRVSVLPSKGLTLTLDAVSTSEARITLVADATATIERRRLVVTDAAGRVLPFADPGQAYISLTTGQPVIDSIEPLFALTGSTPSLLVRGQHLQGALLALRPGVDVQVDTQPSITPDGTELRARIQIAPLAQTGPRTVQILSLSGQSTTEPTVANQFTLVRALGENVTPITSPLVGVRVGTTPGSAPDTASASFTAPLVGLVVGSAALRTTPSVGVRGTSITLVIEGAGLQAVRAVTFDNTEGLVLGAMTLDPQGTRISLPLSIAANAPRTGRRVVLQTAAGRLHFTPPVADQFLVAAPSPEVVAVEPQVVEAGKTITLRVRGRNFSDVTGVRFDPPQGLTVSEAATAQEGGTVLSVAVRVAADALTGPRTLIVDTAGGASPADRQPGNSFHVAQRVGPTRDAIAAPAVGLVVGTAAPGPRTSAATLGAPLVGVVVRPAAREVRETVTGSASPVGVVVGAAALGLCPQSPDGVLRGGSAVLSVAGVGLSRVVAVKLMGPAGVTVAAPLVSADGREVRVPVTAAANAPAGPYGVQLLTAADDASARVIPGIGADLWFSVGELPSVIDSISPIVLESGKSYDFTVRGRGLRDVYALVPHPAAGLHLDSQPVWSNDALGEKLSVRVLVDPAAALGSRVIRLRVPGGITSPDPTPANTLMVVPVQSP